MLGYFSMNVICFEKETVSQGTENYPSILSRQMGAIEIVIPRKCFATRETKRLAKAFRVRLRHGMLSFQLVYFSVTPAESSPFLHLSLKEAFWTLGFQLWEYHSTNITGYFPVFWRYIWSQVKRREAGEWSAWNNKNFLPFSFCSNIIMKQ